MDIFLHIFSKNIVPLFILIILGIGTQRKYNLDVKTLSKLNLSVFTPALIFINLYKIEISYEVFTKTFFFYLLFFLILALFSWFYVKLKCFSPGKSSAILNSVLYYNTGNYGIPLILQVFPDNPLAFTVLLIVMLFQTVLPFTLGIVTINSGRQELGLIFKELVKSPPLWGILFGLVFRVINLQVPQQAIIPLEYLANGFMSVALITLGAQLATINWKFNIKEVMVVNFLRLVASPAIALGIVLLLNLTGTIAQVLIISSAFPTALTVVLLAIEYESEPEFTSQVVLTSTLFSIFSITGVIALTKLLT